MTPNRQYSKTRIYIKFCIQKWRLLHFLLGCFGGGSPPSFFWTTGLHNSTKKVIVLGPLNTLHKLSTSNQRSPSRLGNNKESCTPSLISAMPIHFAGKCPGFGKLSRVDWYMVGTTRVLGWECISLRCLRRD